MPKSGYREESEYLVPENHILPCRLEKVEVKEFPSKDRDTKQPLYNPDGSPQMYQKWEWTFRVSDGEYQGVTLSGLTQPYISNHANNRVRQWAETLLGVSEWEEGRGIDTDDLIGLPAAVTAKHRPPTPKKNGDGMFFPHEIEDVFPASAIQQDEPAF